jgi:hypothetical protein
MHSSILHHHHCHRERTTLSQQIIRLVQNKDNMSTNGFHQSVLSEDAAFRLHTAKSSPYKKKQAISARLFHFFIFICNLG